MAPIVYSQNVFPHLCAGARCRVCWWVALHPSLPEPSQAEHSARQSSVGYEAAPKKTGGNPIPAPVLRAKDYYEKYPLAKFGNG